MKTAEQKARHNEAEKKRRERYPNRVKAQLAKFRASEKYKKWCIRYRKEANEACLRYWHRNKGKVRAYQAIYNRTAKGKLVKIVCLQKRARAKMLRCIPYTTSMLQKRLLLFGHRCIYCNSRKKIVVDHLMPVFLGGWNCVQNFVPACLRCNSSKHKSHPLKWVASQRPSVLSVVRRLLNTYHQAVRRWETV